jgi:hypothetical protein
MQDSRYTVVDYISLTPNKCVIYPRFFKNNPEEDWTSNKKEILEEVPMSEEMIKQLEMWGIEIPAHPKNLTKATAQDKICAPESNKHNFELSKQAQKNLRNKVSWLYYFAKKKTIVTVKGKTLSNFKMNFATLKLPSEQIHPSDFITKNCLNQLFVEISKKHDFKNYVWRLEYQKNGNLHYHIATDTFIDFHFLQRTWNRILNKYGYVDLYTRKFSQMSLMDYVKNQPSGSKEEFSVLQERYARGCREGWKNPNSVDVKAVFGQNNIGYYISKYMAKNSATPTGFVLPVCEQNSKNSRLWFCSRSLSACERVKDVREALEVDVFGTLSRCEGVIKSVHDYCTVLYFDIKKLPAIASKLIRTLLEDYRQEILYSPAG